MAFTEQGLIAGRREALFELVDRPARTGARRVSIPVLLPYSLITVDGVDYLESNSTNVIAEGGGFHAIPSHGNLSSFGYGERSKGVISASGDGASPTTSVLHKFGWI